MSPMYDPTSHLLVTPQDAEAPRRVARLRELGIQDAVVPEFDAFAREVGRVTETPCAMVNFIDERQQFFAGLYTAGAGVALDPAAHPSPPRVPGRVLPRDHGYCPHVIARRKALVLEDVRDYPRFAGNPLVDEIGIRSYIGAPLLDSDGLVLGTVCAVDQAPRRWGRQGLETIKSMAGELTRRILSAELPG